MDAGGKRLGAGGEQVRGDPARVRLVVEVLRDGKQRFYDTEERIPIDGVVPAKWRNAVVDERDRIERIPYELCTFESLRAAIRRREVWIEGAAKWRNPEDDLPGDFEATRTVHYAAIRQPLDPAVFITDLKQRLSSGLARLQAAIADGSSGGVKITVRRGEPWISIPRAEPLPEPAGLQALKDEAIRRWGVLDLLDVLKNADFLTAFTDAFTSVAAYERIPRAVLQRRLLLVLFALGTNMGIKTIVSTGDHAETEAQLRHVRRHFVTVDNLRSAIRQLVNATLAERDTTWWGHGTASASDSKKFGSWSQNLMTEWHARYGGPGVMIYWHVERKNLCIYSQLKTCSSSEVAAMIEGLLRHCTDADRRGLAALFWSNVNPYGTFRLDIDSRLQLDTLTGTAASQGSQRLGSRRMLLGPCGGSGSIRQEINGYG